MAQFSAIAENVKSMDTIQHFLQHSKRLRFINLHGNSIHQISNLDNCYYLEELDLSSNRVSRVSGLEACESLVKLNLSCNEIKLVSGFDFLYKLQTLNLSYNKISQIKNLAHFSEKRFHLEHLLLHGNSLSSLPGTLNSIKKIFSLKTLTLHSNPLCSNPNYRKVFGDCMPQLDTIDDFPRADDSFSTSDSMSSDSTQPIATPYIDKVLNNHKHLEEDSSTESSSSFELIDHKTAKQSAHQPVLEVNDAAPDQGENKDYTELIKQVMTVMRDEDRPVKLHKDHVEEVQCPPQIEPVLPAPPQDQLIDISAIKNTNKLLLEELEAERERRWKSEQHITQLSDKLVRNEQHIKDYEALNKSSEAGINGIREILLKEQTQKLKLANLLEAFKNKHKDVVLVLSEKDAVIKQREEEVKNLRKAVDNVKDAASAATKNHQLSLQHARQEAQVQRKQCEILRHELNDHQVQVKSLQELIVKREQEHVKDKENCVPLNGEMFNKRVSEVLNNEKEKFDLLNKNLIDSGKQWQAKYINLEKEFRIALYLENKRYEDIHKAYTKISEQLSNHRTQLGRLKSGDSKKIELIEKLKQSVREQSVCIEQLRRSHKTSQEDDKTRIAALDRELEESTRNVLELTSLKKDNEMMKSEVYAQQSVIDGLRVERNLWSKELAEQGTQLSFDRGKLQSDIHKLTTHGSEQTKHIDQLKDSLTIKDHQLTDAMDTITKLKGTITSQEKAKTQIESEFQEQLREISEGRRSQEVQLDSLQEDLNMSDKNRELLSEKYEHVLDENEKFKKKYKDLKLQWEEKVKLFGEVEKAARQMALEHSTELGKFQELVRGEEAARRGLETEVQTTVSRYQSNIQQLEAGHLTKLKAENERYLRKEKQYTDQILKLEEEMRLILHQSQQLKIENEKKLSKLAGALGEFTQLLDPRK